MTNCCLAPTEPFSASISWREHVKHVVFRWDKDDICAVLDNCSLLLLLNAVCSVERLHMLILEVFGLTRSEAGTYNLWQSRRARQPLHHWCGSLPSLIVLTTYNLSQLIHFKTYDQKFLLSLSNLSDSFSPFVKAFTIVQEACFI